MTTIIVWSLKRLIIGISQIIILVTMVTKVRRVICTLKVAKPSKVPEPSNLCRSTNIYMSKEFLLLATQQIVKNIANCLIL